MDDISKIAEVVGVAKKKDGTELRGIGKTGKEWVMYQVILENGIKMNTFGPVSVGDIMFNLKEDPQYHNWKGELKRQGAGNKPADSTQPNMSQPTNAQIMNELLEIKKLLTPNKVVSGDALLKAQLDDKEPDDDYDGEEPDLNIQIPF